MLAVAQGQSYVATALTSGCHSADAVSQLVKRAIPPQHGGGTRKVYDAPPAFSAFCADEIQQLWQHWRARLKVTFALPHPLPPLRLLLV
ncbi:MAG TPA: hypothetical protein V6D19_03020 [Stenomitos sp.]